MKILILNGSPRPNGNTVAMIKAFVNGAKENKHEIIRIDVCRMQIAGCLACEYCHTKGSGQCVQKDAMQEIYSLLGEAEMVVIATPIYYFGFSGQLQCAINRLYAVGIPKKLKKVALILSSGAEDVYDGAIYEYKKIFVDYMKLTDMGVYTAHGSENKTEEKLKELYAFGKSVN